MLNAFRHHRNSHSTGRAPACAPPQVLNAFRHHRNSHAHEDFVYLRGCPCSTPFGIIGIRTRSITFDTYLCPCAQRLSASSEFARSFQAGAVRDVRVLNAFRHHRNSHGSSFPNRTCPSCAQRLSASSEFAPLFWCGVPQQPLVLNAFRHHRNSHAEFMHQPRVSLVCSTPFGIIGIRTNKLRQAAPAHDLCSTPFGIIGIRTLYGYGPTLVILGCSTPFGIIGIRTWHHRRQWFQDAEVLNAFRHHRNSHTGCKFL